ncbi:hypothetical protein C4D60_Mb04t26800 [Musa balbisiana]|uniref:Uncharacterized protein n=1 Tax=Musa balbisiana TaxID=52838 RepID=A0A4S8KEX5_MUSBA|nr:hypothetical protein C4D60_Mb04t26800 [Musa balbisiana]
MAAHGPILTEASLCRPMGLIPPVFPVTDTSRSRQLTFVHPPALSDDELLGFPVDVKLGEPAAAVLVGPPNLALHRLQRPRRVPVSVVALPPLLPVAAKAGNEAPHVSHRCSLSATSLARCCSGRSPVFVVERQEHLGDSTIHKSRCEWR